MSLLQLQRLVDLGRVNTEEPIDLTAICNTKIIDVDASKNHYGINLTDEVSYAEKHTAHSEFSEVFCVLRFANYLQVTKVDLLQNLMYI